MAVPTIIKQRVQTSDIGNPYDDVLIPLDSSNNLLNTWLNQLKQVGRRLITMINQVVRRILGLSQGLLTHLWDKRSTIEAEVHVL